MKSRLFRVAFFFFAAGTISIPPAGAVGPDYSDIYNLDAEYELDRLMGDIPWEWRDRFRSSVSGFQGTGGSLNIRHLYSEQVFKARFPLLQDRLWFRILDKRNRGLEREEVETHLEFEYSPAPRWYLSFLGAPALHKSDVVVGAAARWGRDEGRSVRFAYLWPGFDTNYAFHNRSINEGYEEFYRRFPQEARLSAVWIRSPLSFFIEGRHRRTSELEHQEFSPPRTRFISGDGEAEAVWDVRYVAGRWAWGTEGSLWRARESLRYEPAAAALDQTLIRERSAARLTLRRTLGAGWAVRVGGGMVGSRGHLRYPGQPLSDRAYRIYDRIGYVAADHAVTARFGVEAGYFYDRQGRKSVETGNVAIMEKNSQNRGKLAIRYDFSENASLRVISAIELDQNQSENFASFDGGTIQFQTTF